MNQLNRVYEENGFCVANFFSLRTFENKKSTSLFGERDFRVPIWVRRSRHPMKPRSHKSPYTDNRIDVLRKRFWRCLAPYKHWGLEDVDSVFATGLIKIPIARTFLNLWMEILKRISRIPFSVRPRTCRLLL